MPDHEPNPAQPLGRRGQAWFLLGLLSGLAACAVEEPRDFLQVLKVVPDSGPGTGSPQDPQRLFLNSRVAVFFTQELDPLSVTPDTLRLVRLTGEGGVVKLREVTVRSRSVILEPDPPITPDLHDGSLQPDQLYRLEIAGLPLTNTVTSLTGQPLRRRHLRYFRTVTASAGETDLPYPLLPVGAPGDVLELRPRPIQMAAASGSLDLHFTLPLVPATVRSQAFEVHRLSGTGKAERLAVASSRVVSRPQPLDPYPGCTVRLHFAETEAVRPGDAVYVLVKGEAGIRDYRDRGLDGSGGGFRRVWVYQGEKAPLLRLPDRNRVRGTLRFEPVAPDRLSFECTDSGWIQPLARRELGDGSLGVFHPKTSMVLEPGHPFELGNGQTVVTGTAFNFRAIHIPEGVTVTVRSRRRVQLRVSGTVRIDGVLAVDTPAPQGTVQPLDLRSPSAVCAYVPVALLAAEVRVAGSIRRGPQASGPGSPLAVIATRIRLDGRIPFHTILAVPRRAHVTGAAQSATVVELSMEPGLPAETRIPAAARTEWRRLPVDFSGRVRARAEDVQGDIEVLLQVAAPDPMDPGRPYLDPSALPRPLRLPLRQPLPVPPGSYVRFLLRAPVVGDALLPRLRALVVEAE